MRVMLTAVIDGVRKDTFDRLMKNGKLPVMEELSKNAVKIERCISSFPSATVTGHASIATSSMPSRHGIVGQAWFDRERKEYVGYDFELTMPDNWIDAKTNLNDRHLMCDTWYYKAKKIGFRTFSADLIRKDADLKMSFILPGTDRDMAVPEKLFFLRRFSKHISEKKSGFLKKVLLKLMPFHVLQHEIVSGNVLKAVRAGYNFGIFWFMETDAASHIYGPETLEGEHGKPYLYDSFEDAIRDADEEIGKIFNSLKEHRVYFNITTDHGQSRLGSGKEYHVSLSAEMTDHGVNAFTRIDPHEYESRVGKKAQAVVAPSGPRMAHIYLLDRNVYDRVYEFLLENRAVEFVFWKHDGRIMISDGKTSCRIENYNFGDEYPKAVERVRGLLENSRSGDFVVTAKKGYEFQISDYRGAHGGLNVEDSTGFAIIYGPDYREESIDEIMITDVLKIAIDKFTE